IHSHNLCAGSLQGGINTCQGDSGGPLMCQARDANYFWLVGVTSWGKDCGRSRQPSVYTSTQHFHHWILLQTGLVQTERTSPTPRTWAPAPTRAAPAHRPSP
ncbi:ACRO protein, partial [Psilopogon haemacephalus]|nr:ACRO protein [Psilopogon haemacephalus]